jgi:hypothetical protein
MVWSNDLAKLKQSLKAAEGESAHEQRPPAKTKPQPPQVWKSLEEEDAMFLTAMGKAAAPAPKPGAAPSGSDGFGEAMRGLGGVRSLATDRKEPKGPSAGHEQTKGRAAVSLAPLTPLGAPAADPAGTSPSSAARGAQKAGAASAAGAGRDNAGERAEGAPHPLPEMIHLAAGMTIEVDGVLDLRRHNEVDAGERLKEKVMDGACLGWRAMHVILGNSGPLRQVLLEYMASPPARMLAKYGEAPVPMGGAQAWILYFVHAHDPE